MNHRSATTSNNNNKFIIRWWWSFVVATTNVGSYSIYTRITTLLLVLLLLPLSCITSFLSFKHATTILPSQYQILRIQPSRIQTVVKYNSNNNHKARSTFNVLLYSQKKSEKEYKIQLDISLTDERIRQLYAWICQAFYNNDERYNNLMYAMIAIFGTSSSSSGSSSSSIPSPLQYLLDEAIQQYNDADTSRTNNKNSIPMGEIISQYDRERRSLGAMGAGQWSGQYMTRPHALLDIRNYTCIQDWEQSLGSRGCRRTIQRAVSYEMNATYVVSSKPIVSNLPAPHSTYEHFKCVVQHEVRLLQAMYGTTSRSSTNDDSNTDDDNDDTIPTTPVSADDINIFFSALSEAISRYMGTTQMTGLIREYRTVPRSNTNHTNTTILKEWNNDENYVDENNNTSSEVIAFAHEIRKGRTVRGQWFYATDIAAKQYVWFHSVRSLIERSIQVNNEYRYSIIKNGTEQLLQQQEKELWNINNNVPITMVDLGPSGSDDFTTLKEKYGFITVEDWPAVADYHGPFWDYSTNQPVRDTGSSTFRRLFDW